jgi:hypothetical protein
MLLEASRPPDALEQGAAGFVAAGFAFGSTLEVRDGPLAPQMPVSLKRREGGVRLAVAGVQPVNFSAGRLVLFYTP